jgi:hypothetical protein
MSSPRQGAKRAFSAGRLVLLALLFAGACKWGAPDYTLNVVLDPGVTGTPEAGKHAYKELTTVVLSYTAEDPLETVEVFLNGNIRKAGSDSLVMFGDGYELRASLVDVRAAYKITLTYTNTAITAPDPFIVTLTGGSRLSGDFTDSRGYHGTWTAQSNSLVLAYWDWDFYVLTNTVFNMGYASGTFNGGGESGTWTAVKQ